MSTVRNCRCINSGSSLTAATPNVLIDVSTNMPALLPAAAIPLRVFMYAKTPLSEGVKFTVGYDDDPTALVPLLANLTTTDIGEHGLVYTLSGEVKAVGSDSREIVVTPSMVDVTGTLELYIEYVVYNDLQ